MKQENRQHSRIKAKWPVSVETRHGVINTETCDIGADGAFIRSLKPFSPHEVFKIFINIPQVARRLTVSSEVVWANVYGADNDNPPTGMGVRFIRISKSDRGFLRQMIKNRV